jgi:predicted PurR-regulated permease PerM
MQEAQLSARQHDDTEPDGRAARLSYRRRVLTAVGIAALVIVLLLLLESLIPALVLGFAGLLLAILLRSPADWLSVHTPLSDRWSLALVVAVLVGLLALAGWLVAPAVAAQLDQLVQTLPQSFQQFEQHVSRYAWGEWLTEQTPPVDSLLPSGGNFLARITGIFSTTLDLVVKLLIVMFVGLYLAASPRRYVDGLVTLIPPGKRTRVREILRVVGYTLRWWLIGQLFAMAVVGLLTGLGLWLLGMPLALTLGLFAGLMEFIPNIGPILALLPAVLLALIQSPQMALYVLLLYLGIQVFESYLLLPLVLQRTVSLPPALLILAVFGLGLLLGFVGVFIAAPLTAAVLVIVKMLYVEDTLGDQIDVPGEQTRS